MQGFLSIMGDWHFWILVAGYWVFMAFVGSLEMPNEKDGRGYRMFFKFFNALAGNISRAFAGKIPGANGGGNGKPIAMLILCVALLALGACGARAVRAPVAGGLTTEQIARGVYEKYTAFLRQAQANHPECSADQPTATQGVCPALQRAIRVQNKIADGIHAYCSGLPAGNESPYTTGGPCSPVLGAEPNLQAALAEALNQMSLYGGKL